MKERPNRFLKILINYFNTMPLKAFTKKKLFLVILVFIIISIIVGLNSDNLSLIIEINYFDKIDAVIKFIYHSYLFQKLIIAGNYVSFAIRIFIKTFFAFAIWKVFTNLSLVKRNPIKRLLIFLMTIYLINVLIVVFWNWPVDQSRDLLNFSAMTSFYLGLIMLFPLLYEENLELFYQTFSNRDFSPRMISNKSMFNRIFPAALFSGLGSVVLFVGTFVTIFTPFASLMIAGTLVLVTNKIIKGKKIYIFYISFFLPLIHPAILNLIIIPWFLWIIFWHEDIFEKEIRKLLLNQKDSPVSEILDLNSLGKNQISISELKKAQSQGDSRLGVAIIKFKIYKKLLNYGKQLAYLFFSAIFLFVNPMSSNLKKGLKLLEQGHIRRINARQTENKEKKIDQLKKVLKDYSMASNLFNKAITETESKWNFLGYKRRAKNSTDSQIYDIMLELEKIQEN